MTVRPTSPNTPGKHVGLLNVHSDAAVQSPRANGLDASRPLSVSRVANRLAEIIDTRLRGVRTIWVQGEIGDLRKDARGTLRFSLSDGRSRLECVWWTPAPSTVLPDDGMQVVAKGCPKVFTRTVGLVYVVSEIRSVGAGEASAHRERLRVRLSAEGLFDLARKRALPRVPRAVAIITGRSSAAWHDVLAIARRRHPGIPVVLVPAQMQGDRAPESICAALRAVEACGLFDVVVITRGGGGAADLTAFDDESLARVIAASSVPVVTAVGHEVDYSFADAVADCREPTPSAAAARVVPDRVELKQELDACHLAMATAVRRHLARDKSRLGAAQATMGRSALLQIETGRRGLDRLALELARGLERRVERAREQAALAEAALRSALPHRVEKAQPRLRVAGREIENDMRRRIGSERDRFHLTAREFTHAINASVALHSARLARATAQLGALDPLAVLSRGYAVVRGPAGEMITSVRQVPPGATLSVRFHDGAITVEASAAGRVSDISPGVQG